MALTAPRPGLGEGDLYATNPNDQLWLGRQQVPGICTVTVSHEFKADPRSPNGIAGEAFTSSATKNAEGTIQIRIWTDEQHKRLAELWPILWPQRDGQTMYALHIDSALTHLLGVHNVGLSKIDGIEITPEGERVIRFRWKQLRKGKKRVVAEPRDYAGGPSGKGIPDAPAPVTAQRTKPSAGRAGRL